MIILCTVDITTREVTIPSDQRIASYDHKVDVIRFQVETIPGFSLDTSSIRIAAQGPNKARHDYAVDPSTVSIEEETGYITFDWPIPAGVTEMPIGTFKYGDKGQLIFAVCAEIISGDTVSKAWHSDDGIITVVAHLEPESGGGEDPEEEATNAQKIGQLQTDVAVINTQIGALANGSPTPVATVAEMTDESAVYLYTGSETGYTAGNWYYYNGSAWTSGGTYGGAVTDTTLSISGKPADSKAVGDALAEKADSDDVAALDTRVTGVEEYADIFTADVDESVRSWLDEHPEATTTVEDNSLTAKKLVVGTLGYVTPEDYGAKGDGQTDDTQALQDAVDEGGVVHLKSGATYLISEAITLTKPISIYGKGAIIKQATSHTNTLYASGVSNIIIDGVHIIGYGDDYVGQGGQTAPYGINITAIDDENRVSEIVVKNCIVEDCTWCGINVSRANNVLIENNKVIGTGDNDLQYKSNYQFGIDFGYGDNIKVCGNDVSETAQGFYIGKKASNVEVSGNVIHDIIGQHGVYATSGIDFIFTNNIIKDIGLEGIKLQLDANSEEDAVNIMIVDNCFENTGSFAVHTTNLGAPTNTYLSKNIVVKNNVIKACAVGVYISEAENVSVSGNMITGGNEGILFSNISDKLVISDNSISGLNRRGIGNYITGAVLDAVFVCRNILKECGQEGAGTATSIAVNIMSITCDTLFVDGNTVSDENSLMYRAMDIGGSNFVGDVVFVNNHTYGKPVQISRGLKEFKDNVCEGGLAITSNSFIGQSSNIYTVSTLPADLSAYRNGDMFIITGGTAQDYAFAMLLNSTWVMLGKRDGYVIHPTTLISKENYTVNEFTAVSEGNKLTVHVNVTINVRGTESKAGSFSADSSLLPSAKTNISDSAGISISPAGVLTIGFGTAGETYDVTGVFIDGVLQS